MNIERDIGFTKFLRENLPEWSILLFELITYFGDLRLILTVLGAVWLLDIWRGITNEERSVVWTDRTAYFVGIVLGGLALIVMLKTMFALPRPPATLHTTSRDGFGFPSGHTMAATILWGAFVMWGRLGSHHIRFVMAGLLIGFVALSRLALGVHYLPDVIASIGFGVCYLLIARHLATASPKLMFSGTIVLGVVTVIISGASQDGLLALLGTFSAALGWWLLTIPTVRTWIRKRRLGCLSLDR